MSEGITLAQVRVNDLTEEELRNGIFLKPLEDEISPVSSVESCVLRVTVLRCGSEVEFWLRQLF